MIREWQIVFCAGLAAGYVLHAFARAAREEVVRWFKKPQTYGGFCQYRVMGSMCGIYTTEGVGCAWYCPAHKPSVIAALARENAERMHRGER